MSFGDEENCSREPVDGKWEAAMVFIP